MKGNTKTNVNKHMRHASNGTQSNIILQNLDKNEFVKDKQVSEAKDFDANSIKTITLFASHNKLINYCNSIGLIKLGNSSNPSSQKLFQYSVKLLEIKTVELKNQNLLLKNKSISSKEHNILSNEVNSLKALNNFLKVITNSFPDITYGLGALKDYNLKTDEKKFLSLAINTYYNRVFSSSAFVQHFLHKASTEEKQEFLEFNKDFGLMPKNIDTTSIKLQESYSKDVVDQKLEELKIKFSEELKEKYIKDELLLDDLDNILELKESKQMIQKEFELLKIQHQNELLQIVQKKEKEKEDLINDLSEQHRQTELELKNKIVDTEKKLQEQEIKIYELEEGVKMSNENYLKAKEEIEILNQKQKTFEEKAKTFEEKALHLQKLVDEYEKANAIGFKTIIAKDLTTKIKLADSDDESEEDDISLSKPKYKEGKLNEVYSSDTNKQITDLLFTNHCTDNVISTNTNDHVSCNGEDSFHSDSN